MWYFHILGFHVLNASWCSSLHQAKNYWVEPECRLFHTFHLLPQCFCLKFRWYIHSISGEFIPHRFKFVYVAITSQPWTLFFYLLTCGTPPPPPPFHAFSPPSQGISQRILIFLPLVQGTTWRPSSSILLSEPFFLSVLLQSGDKMAVVSLFTFASLTDGRTVRDLPKQHTEKKTPLFFLPMMSFVHRKFLK